MNHTLQRLIIFIGLKDMKARTRSVRQIEDHTTWSNP